MRHEVVEGEELDEVENELAYLAVDLGLDAVVENHYFIEAHEDDELELVDRGDFRERVPEEEEGVEEQVLADVVSDDAAPLFFDDPLVVEPRIERDENIEEVEEHRDGEEDEKVGFAEAFLDEVFSLFDVGEVEGRVEDVEDDGEDHEEVPDKLEVGLRVQDGDPFDGFAHECAHVPETALTEFLGGLLFLGLEIFRVVVEVFDEGEVLLLEIAFSDIVLDVGRLVIYYALAVTGLFVELVGA